MVFKLGMTVDVCMAYAHVRFGGLNLVARFYSGSAEDNIQR